MGRRPHKHRKFLRKIFLHGEWQYVAVTMCEKNFDKAKYLPKADSWDEVECRKCLSFRPETLSRIPYIPGWVSKLFAKVGL